MNLRFIWKEEDVEILKHGVAVTEDYNKNHKPSGSEKGGQFAPSEGGGSEGESGNKKD